MTSPQPAPSPPARARGWAYRPELDGLRTLAVVVIVFFHVGVQGASNAFIMLDLFFVLSGFLVTNVVLAEVDARGGFRVGQYFARRVRRLLPAAVVVILATSVVFLLVVPQPQRLELVRDAQAALVYMANWQFIADGADYFAGDVRDSPFMHFWSLSVEEQYYIVFPLLIAGWLKVAPHRERVLLAALGVLIALSVVSQVYWGQVDPSRAYYATDARLFQLLAGAAMAVAVREFAVRGRIGDGGVTWPVAGRALALSGLLGYVVFGTELVQMSVSSRNLLATVVAGSLVLGVYTAPRSIVARGFALPWMTYLGKISYGIYLWHWPTVLVLERVFAVRPLVIAVMALVLAIAMASMSYQLLETPIRTSRRLAPFPWRAVGGGLTVSVLMAAFVVSPVLSSPRTPSVVTTEDTGPLVEAVASRPQGNLAERIKRPVPKDIDFERAKQDEGPKDQWCRPSAPQNCVAVKGSGPHIVLVGDSHGRMLARAFMQLAEEKGFKLSVSIVTACPWPDGIYNTRIGSKSQERCLKARPGFYAKTLPAMNPDVVVLTNLARSSPAWQGDLATYDGKTKPLHQMQKSAIQRTVRLINDAGADAVMIKSIMGTEGWDVGGFDPLDCLAQAEDQSECTVSPPKDQPVADAIYESVAVGNPRADTVDVNPLICPDSPVCLPVLGGHPVWRDDRHITPAVARHVRDGIWARIQGTGLLADHAPTRRTARADR
jgi:peptidoglycan/LPS O-acetylase OafA/YrhL